MQFFTEKDLCSARWAQTIVGCGAELQSFGQGHVPGARCVAAAVHSHDSSHPYGPTQPHKSFGDDRKIFSLPFRFPGNL